LLILGVAVVLISDAVKPRAETIAARALSLRLRGGWPMLLFTIALVLGIIRGALGGGDMYIGLWEVRYLLYVPACYLIARGALRTPQHVGGLLRIGLAAAILFAIEGAYRRIALIDTGLLGVTPEFSYEHEDVLFLAVFVLLVLAAYVFGAFRRVRVAGLFVAPLMLFTLFATERRAGIIVLFVGILVIAMTTLFVRRKAFIIAAFPILIISVLYLAAFWNAAGIAGQPARAIKSLYEPDPRDAASNLYRVLETINIDATIHSDPLLGVGFGQQFLMVVGLPDLSWWPFWRYETHNAILWVWMKTGVIGYVLFWVMIGGAISRAAFAAKRLFDPTLRSAALFCLVAIVGTVVFAYVDLGLVSGRVMVLLGTALGILAVVERIDRASPRPVLAAA
ncbi:MAG TPA: O-antigen ligase family protein, partial [Candidatus Polarisedimenticolia bacterium]|nr:O-antigen ligase family protein [Candidatus Polarisedimenticolia bacterium]